MNTKLKLISVPGENKMIVANDISWRCVVDDQVFFLPEGFIFDGASIPRPLWSVYGGPFGKYRDAACLHDFLYAYGSLLGVSRKKADHYFYRRMINDRISHYKAKSMYGAVYIFGKKYYQV